MIYDGAGLLAYRARHLVPEFLTEEDWKRCRAEMATPSASLSAAANFR